MTAGSDRRRALLVGCGTFADGSLTALRSPAKDVSELGRVLGDSGRGGYDVTTLVDRTSAAVQREIEGFFAGARTSDALNLLYLSCHGVLDARGRLYFAFADTEREYLGSTAVSAEWIRDRMRSSRSRATLVLVDCCFSGAFLTGMTRSAGIEVATLVRHLPASSGVAVLTASGDTEAAFEDAEAEAVRPSYFTGAVVDGIATGAADLNGDGRITVDELYDYVHDRAVRGESPQRPRKLGTGEGTLVVAEAVQSRGASATNPVAPARVVATPERPHGRKHPRRPAIYALAAVVCAAAASAAFALPGLPRSDPDAQGRADTAVLPSGTAAVSPAPASMSAKPSSTTAAPSVAAKPTRAPAPATTSTPAPVQPQKTGRTVAPQQQQPAASSGGFSAPGNGADVLDCAYFSGTARLAAGETLILAMRNLSNGDPARYVEYVFNWDEPATLSSWRGAQYFGGEPGQRYRIELMAVDLDDTRSAAGDNQAANALAGQGRRLATREVVRQNGSMGHACEG
jgi:hypothetical protein